LEYRAAHRASDHPVARHTRRLAGAALAAALLGLPLGVASPAQADVSSQWPLQYLKADQVWGLTKGSGATVAVLDTGVASIPDTQASLLSGADFSTSTTSVGNGQSDDDGHGTAMAVTIAGAGSVATGLAPSAKILPVRITDGNSSGPDLMAAGIRYAISQHVSVINLSQVVSAEDATLASAIQAAVASNIVVVAGTGNDGGSSVSYPGAYPGVVAVGASDQTGSLWSDSDTGPQVTLLAPGVNIPQEDETGGPTTGTGTSASTAYVSATVALIRSAHPSWTAGQVIRDLISTADPMNGMSAGAHNNQDGYGVVDPLKALQASTPSETSNPLLASTTGSSASATPTNAASSPAAAKPASKSNVGLIVGIVVAALVVIVALVLVLNRRSRNKPGGPGPGGPGGGQPPYGQYPQQPPQQSPYYGPPQGQQQYPPS